MKLACFLVLSVSGWAAEAVDRVAIGRVVASLNEVPRPISLFLADAEGSADLDRLQQVRGRVIEIRLPDDPADRARVVISHEPFGEAVLIPPRTTSELTNPRITSGAIRFVTPDVALAEGTYQYQEDSKTQTTPLLVVLKRVGEDWKIASFRVLTQRP